MIVGLCRLSVVAVPPSRCERPFLHMQRNADVFTL